MPTPPPQEFGQVILHAEACHGFLHELLRGDRPNFDRLLTHDLPALYAAIGGLYDALGESQRLESPPDDTPDVGSEPTSRSEVVIDTT